MPGKKIQEYQGPAPIRQPNEQVANYPSDPAEREQLCRFAVNSLKELVPDLAVYFPRQETSK